MLINNIKPLQSLQRYRYLTARQFAEIGIFKSDRHARESYLYRVKNRRYAPIKAVDFGCVAGKGKLPQIHHLTKYGVEILAEEQDIEPETIRYPIGKIQFSRDYFHRVEFISLHIALRKYAEKNGHRVDFWHSYFDNKGNQRQRNTQLIRDTQVKLYKKTIIPDGNFRLNMTDGQSRLFTLELHKGTNTKRIIAQLENHARLIELELLPEKYNHPYDNYVLSVYDHQGTMEAVKRRFLDSRLLSEYQEYYIFNTSHSVIDDFSKNWYYFDNKPFMIF